MTNTKYRATLSFNEQVLFSDYGSNPTTLFAKLLSVAEDYPTVKGEVVDMETTKIVHRCCKSQFE